MTLEDINEVVTKSMPQWKKDQFDAIHANADYIDWLRRKIERLEEKLKSHNKDYGVQQEASPKLPSLEVLTEELIKTGWLLRASGDNLFEENKRYGVEVVLSVIKRLGDFA